MRNHRLFLGALLLIFAAGCSQPPPRATAFVSPKLLSETPARIVVVPFAAPRGMEEGCEVVTSAFALEVQRILHSDVIMASPGDERLKAECTMWQRGRVDVESLIQARKNYMADAFLFGAITHYKPYDPPIIGVKIRMLSAQTGDVIWAAGGLFDARDADVRWLGAKFFKSSGLRDRLYGPEWVFMSPALYAAFVACEILAPLDQQVQKQFQGVAKGR